jgi:hypothetical protein
VAGENPESFIVKDSEGHPLAYVHFEEEHGVGDHEPHREGRRLRYRGCRSGIRRAMIITEPNDFVALCAAPAALRVSPGHRSINSTAPAVRAELALDRSFHWEPATGKRSCRGESSSS